MGKLLQNFSPTALGIFFACTGFFLFNVGDAGNKYLKQFYSTETLLFFDASIGASLLLIGCLCLRKLKPLAPKKIWVHLIFGLFALSITYCSVTSFSLMPLTDAYAIIFMAPLLSTIFAGLLLKEKIHSYHWICTLLGFFGVMVVSFPGWSLFSADGIEAFLNHSRGENYKTGILFGLGTALFFACRTIFARKFAQAESSFSMAFTTQILVYIPLIGAYWIWEAFQAGMVETATFTLPQTEHLWLFLIVGASSIIGMVAMAQGLIYTPSKTVAPLHYTQLVWGAIIGYFVFDDVPTSDIIFGATLIIAAGMYIAIKDTKQDKAERTVAAEG